MGALRTKLFRVLVAGGVVSAVIGTGVMMTGASPAAASITSITAYGNNINTGQVSCTGPTTCTDVGGTDAQTLVDGVWSAPIAFNGIEFTEYQSSAVSCTDALDCTAVGATTTSGQPAYITETDGTWGPVVQVGTLDQGGTLNSVSCTSALDCTAVGYGSAQGETFPIAFTETDGTWGPATAITPYPSETLPPAYLNSVSCISAGNCVAVGDGYTPPPTNCSVCGSYAIETDGVWGPYTFDLNWGLSSTILESVSCPDANDCTAVGQAPDATIATSYHDGSWGPAIDLPGSDGGLMDGVSCVDANDCTAVGNSSLSEYEVETDGAWSDIPVEGQGGWLSSVSCTSANDCTAVGTGIYTITNTPTVTVSDNAPLVGHDLTFTATVAGTDAPAPTGAVSWNVLSSSDGFPPCSSTTGPVSTGNVSTYTCTMSDAAAGLWRATASFGGDSQYAAVSSDEDDTTVANIGGTLTLSKNKKAYGGEVMQVAGSGWNVNGDTGVTLYQCATETYQSTTCDQATKVAATVGTGKKAGTFKKAKLHLTAGPIDTRGDTCGLATSAACYVVGVGSTGDEGASLALAFKPPSATLKSASNVVANTVDKPTAAYFPAGDTVIAEECDSSVTVPTTLASDCDPSTKITGSASVKGKVAFSSPGVTVVDGASYTESGSGTVLPGGHADVVIDDTTTAGAFVIVPITLHS